MKLAIISHTLHYKKPNGDIVGWGPTITEINHLMAIFDEIYHVAVLSEELAPNSALSYTSDKIHFVPIQKVGGKRLIDKFNILLQMPTVINTVRKVLEKADIFQLRTPTGMGVYLIPYLTFFSKKKGWYKYAGNWKEENAAWGFAIQRWMLKKQKRKVTINGVWIDEPNQCIPFENPCLTELDRIEGKKFNKLENKNYKINYCFVGTFYKRKGINKILKSLNNLTSDRFGTFYFVGDGGAIEAYKKKASKIKLEIEFTGFLSKAEIHKIHKKCEYIVLPSENEGFPKVIGEAMNYGCIPIVSNVSCIGQYIEHNKNGFLIEPNTEERLLELLNLSLSTSKDEQEKRRLVNYKIARKFTYQYYNEQIINKIINF